MASLLATGAIAVAVALDADALGFVTSAGFGGERAALLIVGCDLMVAALFVSACRVSPVRDVSADLTSLLSGAIADGVMTFAVSAAAVIALFGDSEPVERLGYLLAILLLVPLCVTFAWRRQRKEPAGERQRFVTLATLASTAGALSLARILTPLTAGLIGTSLFVLLELVAARVAITLSVHVMPTAWLRRLQPSTVLVATPLLLAVSAGSFIPTATISLVDVAVPFSAAMATFCLICALKIRPPPRAYVRVFDVSVLVVAALIVFYVGPLSPTLAENHDFFLGPSLDVLHGHPMLVDTFSQYGVGMIYALVTVFLVVPIGYGTFALLLSGLTVLLFAVIYAVLRLSTRSVLVAAIGLTTMITLDLFGQIGFYVNYPSTGVLRFGLPWGLILCSVAAARMTRHKELFEGLALVIVAVAAVWSGEAAAYCLGTAVALACLRAAVADTSVGARIRLGARHIAVLLTVSAVSVLVFTLIMRAATGVWPDWGGYLEYIRLYTIGGFSALPIDPWSPGLAIGGIYTVSAIVIVLVVTTRPALVRERAAAFRAVTGITVFGSLAYSYFLGRSHPNNVIHISPPAVALLFVWFDIARSTLNSRVAVAVASATIVFFGTMIVAGEGADIRQKYSSTALAATLGAAAPLEARLRTLGHNPVIEPAAAHIVHFVRSIGVRRTSLTLLLAPALDTEVLLRLGVASAVGSSTPLQEFYSPRGSARALTAVRSLRPGGIVVISVNTVPLSTQVYAFSLLGERFVLQEIAADGQGLQAFRMAARR